jgi:hypothetical protein
MQSVSKRPLQFLKLIYIYSEDVYSILNCHNVAKHVKFYMWQLWFIVASTGSVERFKKSFTILFQILLCGEYYENVYT